MFEPLTSEDVYIHFSAVCFLEQRRLYYVGFYNCVIFFQYVKFFTI